MCGVVGLLELVEELVVVDGVLLLVVVSGPGPTNFQFISKNVFKLLVCKIFGSRQCDLKSAWHKRKISFFL